jgi:hypothetical protein
MLYYLGADNFGMLKVNILKNTLATKISSFILGITFLK